MKRRSFLASLFVLPFVAKPLQAIASAAQNERHRRALRAGTEFALHKREIEENAAGIQYLTETWILQGPSGYKIAPGRYDIRALRELGGRRNG